jgi:hypothetical protein
VNQGFNRKETSPIVCNQSVRNSVTMAPHPEAGPCVGFVVVVFVVASLAQ